jgi:hypothetical protein
MRVQLRWSLAAIAVAAVLAYGTAGHGVSEIGSHEGMAGSAVGLCLLLVTVLGRLLVPRLQIPPRPLRTAALAMPAMPLLRTRPDGRSRASPIALQRFRN